MINNSVGKQNIILDRNCILSSSEKLDTWLQKNGWAGYDPYDIKGTPLFLYLQRLSPQAPLHRKALRRALFALENRYPLLMRRLFGVKKQINAKAMGLFAKAYLNLYEVTLEERFRDEAIECLDWLLSNHSPGYSGLCWGYPFHWQSKVFIPRGTPSAVVSCVVGDGFWTAYQILRDKKYLDACESICRFLINDLNIDEIDEDCICFSYTPVDDFHVHNANLFAAEFLIRVGQELKEICYLELGRRAANYALREQNSDGSLYYWGRIQNHYSPHHIDHYHSGFEIRMLYGIWRLTRDSHFREATQKYFHFYLDNLVAKSNGQIIPKMTPHRLYPINIHSCAEAILCNATLADEFEEARLILYGLCDWIVTNMQTEAGWFIYMILKGWAGERRIEIPYIRWGQAWMLLALSTCLLVMNAG